MRFSIPRFWRERESRYRLKATKCKKCGRINYPPSIVCRYCGATDLEEIYLENQKAKLIAWSVIYTVPEGFEEQRPWIIGMVELIDSGVRILAPITDVLPEELKKGLILEPVLRRVNEDRESGLIHYGTAFRPVIKPVGGRQET